MCEGTVWVGVLPEAPVGAVTVGCAVAEQRPLEKSHFPVGRAATSTKCVSVSFGKPQFKTELLMHKEALL